MCLKRLSAFSDMGLRPAARTRLRETLAHLQGERCFCRGKAPAKTDRTFFAPAGATSARLFPAGTAARKNEHEKRFVGADAPGGPSLCVAERTGPQAPVIANQRHNAGAAIRSPFLSLGRRENRRKRGTKVTGDGGCGLPRQCAHCLAMTTPPSAWRLTPPLAQGRFFVSPSP